MQSPSRSILILVSISLNVLILALLVSGLLPWARQGVTSKSPLVSTVVDGDAKGAGNATVSASPPSSTTTPPSPGQDVVATGREPAIALRAPNPEPRVRLPRGRLPMQPAALEAEARLVAEVLLKEMPNDARALHVAAVCKAQLRETDEAEKLWKKCIELDPQGEPYYMNLAANALNRGDSAGALQTLEQARGQRVDSADVSHHMALALTNLGRDEEALAELQATLAKTPELGAHLLLLGQTQLKIGDATAAKEALLKAQRLGISGKPLTTALMNSSVRLGEKDEALKYREQLQQFEIDHPVAGRERYAAASEGEARRTVISVLREASAVYQQAKRWIDVETLNLRLAALDPTDMSPCRTLADVYANQSRWIDLLAVRERVLEAEPQNLMNYLLAAKAASDAQLPSKAEAYLKLAISVTPLAAVGYAAMAEFLLEQSRADEAEWYVRQALTREPSETGFRLLARILRTLGKESEAQAAEALAQQRQ